MKNTTQIAMMSNFRFTKDESNIRRELQDKTPNPVQVNSAPFLHADTGLPGDIEIQIRRRAYQLFSSRGERAGDDLADWLEAEKEFIDM